MSTGQQYWSMTEGVFNCLIDEKRSRAFKRAIFRTIRDGDIVVDMGTGSGILAMFAAQAGAKRVYAIEYDKRNIATLTKTFKKNGFENIIIPLLGDVTKVALPEKVDVIIGEMIATALIEELQVPATANMLKYAKPSCRVLLNNYQTYLDLVFNNSNYYGNHFEIIRYEYPDLKKLTSQPFSKKHLLHEVDFSQPLTESVVKRELVINSTHAGTINALRLSGRTTFYDGSNLGATFAYDYPIILPIDSLNARKGDKFLVKITYKVCGGSVLSNTKLTSLTHE